jgi:hypothetical protein
LKRQRSREIITGISVKKAKKILQTYHRIKEWEVNLFICYMKISRQKHVHVCEDMMQLKFMHNYAQCIRERPFNLKGGGGLCFFSKKIFWFPVWLKKIFWFWWRKKK